MIKKHLKCTFLLFWLSIVINPIHSQVKQSHSIVLGFLQLKEEANLGMVFNGIHLEYRYGLTWTIHDHEITYQPKIGAGIALKREPGGPSTPDTHEIMKAIKFHIAPINVSWTMPFFEKNGHSIRGGANFIMHYNYQKYDDIHDGPLFWNAEIGFSPIINYGYQWNNKRIKLGLQNSLFGFTSHRQGYDPYIWLPTWKDYILDPHKNLKFGSFNEYNHTNVSLEFVPNIFKIHSIVYEFDYLGYFKGIKFQQINHNFIWRMSL
ncbi:MAG: hypothetical protein FWH35_01380 [Treponema sp.]|nr:hypothetical protein [Treponema sp.]